MRELDDMHFIHQSLTQLRQMVATLCDQYPESILTDLHNELGHMINRIESKYCLRE